MSRWYYYDAAGTRLGPVSSQEVRQLVANGVIVPKTKMEKDSGHRGLAETIPGLFPAGKTGPLTQGIHNPSVVQSYCTNCGHPTSPNAEVCLSCGLAPFSKRNFCRQCGQELTPEQSVCVWCGAPVKSAEKQRSALSSKNYLVMMYLGAFLFFLPSCSFLSFLISKMGPAAGRVGLMTILFFGLVLFDGILIFLGVIGLLLTFMIWITKRDKPDVKWHGKNIANALVSYMVYCLIFTVVVWIVPLPRGVYSRPRGMFLIVGPATSSPQREKGNGEFTYILRGQEKYQRYQSTYQYESIEDEFESLGKPSGDGQNIIMQNIRDFFSFALKVIWFLLRIIRYCLWFYPCISTMIAVISTGKGQFSPFRWAIHFRRVKTGNLHEVTKFNSP